MNRNEKIKQKFEETRERVIIAVFTAIVLFVIETILVTQIGYMLKGVEPLRFVLGVVVILLFCGLAACETYWACDFIHAAFRDLKNVVQIAMYQIDEIEFVGNKGKRGKTETKEEE